MFHITWIVFKRTFFDLAPIHQKVELGQSFVEQRSQFAHAVAAASIRMRADIGDQLGFFERHCCTAQMMTQNAATMITMVPMMKVMGFMRR